MLQTIVAGRPPIHLGDPDGLPKNTPPPVQDVPFRALKPSMVAKVNGFVDALKPLVLAFQSSKGVPAGRVTSIVNVSVSIVEPVLFVIKNCTGVPPKLGRFALFRLVVVRLKALSPSQVTAPPQGADGFIVNWSAEAYGVATRATPISTMNPQINRPVLAIFTARTRQAQIAFPSITKYLHG
jgi:hypothetical protein